VALTQRVLTFRPSFRPARAGPDQPLAALCFMGIRALVGPQLRGKARSERPEYPHGRYMTKVDFEGPIMARDAEPIPSRQLVLHVMLSVLVSVACS